MNPSRQFTNIGGQAVIEGVMMRSPNSITISVRRPDKKITTKKRRYQTITQRFKKLNLSRLRLEIVESDSEIETIRRKLGPWVVIVQDGPQNTLIGTRVNGCPGIYPVPGAFLTLNGLKPFLRFESAEYTAKEAQRQSGCATTISCFDLRLVCKLKKRRLK